MHPWDFFREAKKQKKALSTSQPHFRSENTPATIEADHILLAFQQLASNSNSANFNNNNNRISKLHKSLTTTMSIFDWKSEKFDLFEDLFQTSLKFHNQVTEDDRIHYFHSLMRDDALQTFKNISSPNREILAEILTVFHRNYVKPQSMATAKHKFQGLIFNPTNQKVIGFLDVLQNLEKDAFGVAAQAIIEKFIYAKMTHYCTPVFSDFKQPKQNKTIGHHYTDEICGKHRFSGFSLQFFKSSFTEKC